MRRTKATVLLATATAVIGTFAVSLPAAAAPIMCHGKQATIGGTDGSETLHGTSGRDVIDGRGGDDFIDGRGGADLICGGPGADHLNGNAGKDVIDGGLDRVQLTDEGVTERTGDTLNGGRGSDKLISGHDSRPADDVFRDT